MLRFEKLFIQGFKSFCDPTEVMFDQEGITAVVGPNGCGKSNVADAISWVIGEQRAKALRGGKMEDVIFQGSRNRKPSGMAEVILTLVVRENFELRGESPTLEPSSTPDAPDQAPSQTTDQGTDLSPSQSLDQVPDQSQEENGQAQVEPEPATTEVGAVSEQGPPPLSTQAPQEATLPGSKRKGRSAPPLIPRSFLVGERVTVGRRLYRTGESEYEMNGRQCRLRDVQDLFAGTGLGGAHYAIIEQGRIGQVLSAKPLDRRSLIEEAAGVSKFKLRQHAAELKLEASRQNLARVTDILLEIERQQGTLKRQAARATRYRRLKQELRELMRGIFVVDYRETTAAIEVRQEQLARIEEEEKVAIAERWRHEADQAAVSLLARSAESSLNEAREEAGSLDLEVERVRQQLAFLQEQRQSLSARQNQMSHEQTGNRERHAFLEQEITRLRGELQVVEEGINLESRLLTEAEEDHRLRTAQDQEGERELEEARRATYESGTHLERWRQLKRQFTESVDRSQTRIEGLHAERERAISQSLTATERHQSLEQESGEVELRHQSLAEEQGRVADELTGVRRQRAERQELWTSLQRRIAADGHRLQSLRELEERRAYYSEAVQVLLTRQSDPTGFQTLGTLADHVQVAPEFEDLVETALREELQYVVVPTFDDAVQAISFLQAEGAGRATFLVIGLHGAAAGAAGPSGSGQLASGHLPLHPTLESVLGLRPEFADAFRLALPGLAEAWVVENTAEAIGLTFGSGQPSRDDGGSLPPRMSVSRTGERILAGRLITGGSQVESTLGVLQLKREIQEITTRISETEMEASGVGEEVALLESQTGLLEGEARRLDAELREIDKRGAVLREQLQQHQRERERASAHIRLVEQELAQAEAEREETEGRLAHASSELAQAEQVRDELAARLTEAQEAVALCRRQAEDRSQGLSQRRAEFAARTERRRGLLQDLRRLESETEQVESRLSKLEFELIELRETVEQIGLSLENGRLQEEELSARQRSMSERLAERTQQLAMAREQLETIELTLRAVRDQAAQGREARAEQQIELARLSSHQEHLVQTCQAELGEDLGSICERLSQHSPDEPPPPRIVSAEEASEEEVLAESFSDDLLFWTIPPDFDLTAAKARLTEVAARIEALGPINMMALEELAEIESRFDFLSTQKNDLEQAILDTQAAIAEIRKRSKERFLEAFTQINENFKEMFRELFGGGHGEMRLIDESDVLESGIEIIAQPPGKRLQNVLLLSGGEKAMAALSLVMAIFKYRPSPFCLLDEVDAPLDEMNIGRFSDKVVEMSHQTQFMIITHSKRTMEAARTLYGVTMEDPGVSRLLSVKLS
jgi:chromosome segregation protein